MDVGLGLEALYDKADALSLNPCFSGCWSRTLLRQGRCRQCRKVLILVLVDVGLGLADHLREELAKYVLILVLVDVGLGRFRRSHDSQPRRVLILVLVGVGLGHMARTSWIRFYQCLNPCFSGCWSRTRLVKSWSTCTRVLILVLVDVGLGPGR